MRRGCGICIPSNLPTTCAAAACRHRGPEHRDGLSSCRGRALVQSQVGEALLPGCPGYTTCVCSLSREGNSWPCLEWEADVPAWGLVWLHPAVPHSGWLSLGTLYHQLFPTLCLLYPLIKSVVRTLTWASGHGSGLGHSAVNVPSPQRFSTNDSRQH